jgi:hypothetical protein
MILSCVGGRVGWKLHLLRLAVACLQGVMVFEHVAKVLDVLAVFCDRENVIGMRLQSRARLGTETALPLGWLVRKLKLAGDRMHFFALVASTVQALLHACARNFDLVFADHVYITLGVAEVQILQQELPCHDS